MEMQQKYVAVVVFYQSVDKLNMSMYHFFQSANKFISNLSLEIPETGDITAHYRNPKVSY